MIPQQFLLMAFPLMLIFFVCYMALQHFHMVLLNQHRNQELAARALVVIEQERRQRAPRRQRRFKAHPDRGGYTGKFREYWNGEEARFIEAFRMSKDSFQYILDQIRPRITKEDVVGDTIDPATRLAVCLSRLCRGMYFYAIAETYGIGETTAQQIYNEVIRVIVDVLYDLHVLSLLPRTRDEMQELQHHMAFPYAFAAIDGCHLRLQCPIGTAARKDYWCFKQFYSIVLMAIVDGKGRFLWACSGMPGNCHDSTLLQSTDIWQRLKALCETAVDVIGGVTIPSMILGDNAFPFRPYLMKRYSQANRTPEQRAFNKCHASSRVIVENCFGMLKMRFRELFRGSESNPENLKYGSLAAVTLHNIMIDRREPMMVENPDRPGDGIQWLEAQNPADVHPMAARVRDLILPLTQPQ